MNDQDQVMIDEIMEMIYENDKIMDYVTDKAHEHVDHFEKSTGVYCGKDVRDELICQYQVQYLNKLISRCIGN